MIVFFLLLLFGGGGFATTVTYVVELAPGINPVQYALSHGVTYMGATEVNTDLHIFEGTKRLKMTRDVTWLEEQVPRQRHRRQEEDPLRNEQWHLNQIELPENCPYTGAGVTIGVVDDGLQYRHPEILKNYDSHHSSNYNGGPGGNTDPSPTNSRDGHGTSAAAVAAAVKGNNHCGQGVAPNATLAGIRLIAKPVTDLQESQALSKYFSSIDIFTNSWGPEDSGQGVDGPGRLVRETLAKYAGSSIGRNGLGTIYVWASGNGRHVKDSCAFDGYAGNPYVNAIGAVDHTGTQTYYSEGCSNLLAVTPSSGDGKAIVTADLLGADGYDPGECTKTFGGTSSAAPLAAGIFALMLEKRPDLGWRDIRHVVVQSIMLRNNKTEPEHTNAYGFGMLHVPSIFTVLDTYQKVPRKQRQLFSEKITPGTILLPNSRLELNLDLVISNGTNNLDFIENAILITTISHPHRGKIRISLGFSSSGGGGGNRASILADLRDDFNANYENWGFSSLSFWGMSYNVGDTWKVLIENTDSSSGGVVQEIKFGLLGF